MTTKSLKRPASKKGESVAITGAKRSRVAKTAKKSKKQAAAEVSESEPEPEERICEEGEADSVSEEDLTHEEEESEHLVADDEQTEEGVNAKSAWMSKEQREEKKKAQKEEQKRLRLERKSGKPGYDLIRSQRPDWDLARRLDTPKEPRQEALARLFAAFTGQFKDVILKHEGSRVVQTCVKHGSAEQRRLIAVELRGALVEVARNKYGKHIVTKLLLYCPDQREGIMNEFAGQLAKSMRHKEASHVVEAMFADYANAQRKQKMVQEFYGAEFALFHRDQALPLVKVISEHPDKRATIAKSLEEHLGVLLNKGSLGLTLVHRLILEYLEAEQYVKAQEWIASIADFLPEIVHTLDGARAVARCVAMAPSKDRKAIVKSFKPFVEKICRDDRGFQAMLSVLGLVDDTVLVGKTLLGEMKMSMEKLLRDRYGQKVIGYLMCGVNSRLLPLQTIQLLKEVRELASATSKKDDEVRLKELQAQIRSDITAAIKTAGGALLRDIESAVFLSEVLASIDDTEEQLDLFKPVFESIGTTAAFTPGPRCEFLKKAIKSCQAPLASHVFECITGDLKAYATGEGAYMLMHMLRFPDLGAKVRKLLPQLKKLGGEPVAALLRRMAEKSI